MKQDRRTRSKTSRLGLLLLVLSLVTTSTGCQADPAMIAQIMQVMTVAMQAASGSGSPSTPGAGSIASPMPTASVSPFPGSAYPTNPASQGTYGPASLFPTTPGGLPGQDQSQQARQAGAPVSGSSFFESLPVPQGSWHFGGTSYFWDCRGSSCHRPHNGVDLHTDAGTPVFAVAAGTVERIKYDAGGYHWYIIIRHDATASTGENYNTLYGHIEVADGLQEGARVTAGQQIATVSSRQVSSPHCHFEVLIDDGGWKGSPVNPNAYADFHPPGRRGSAVYAGEPPHGRNMV